MSSLATQLRSLVEAQNKLLSQLHVELGYDSPEALAQALLQAGGTPEPSRRPAKSRSKRARISEATRTAIRAALKKGERGVEVVRRFKISYPTVHAIKSELGLVKSRPKSRAQLPAA